MMSVFDPLVSVAKQHKTAAMVVGGGAGALMIYLAYQSIGNKTTQTTTQNPVAGTMDIGGQPGVLGFVGWAPTPNSPTAPATNPTSPPSGTNGSPAYTWKPSGAQAVSQSPGKMVWYAAYKGTSSDPNLQYINVYNRSGQLMETVNTGCVNKDTPGGEMCILNGKLYTGGTAGAEENTGGQGGPYAGSPNYESVQPYGGAGGILPTSVMNIPQFHALQPGETAEMLARKYYGNPNTANRLLQQAPDWNAGSVLKLY